jgi:hypothetical protein
MALVISKHIELKSGISMRRFVDAAYKISDGHILHQITDKVITIKAAPTDKMHRMTEKLFPPH